MLKILRFTAVAAIMLLFFASCAWLTQRDAKGPGRDSVQQGASGGGSCPPGSLFCPAVKSLGGQ